MSDNSRNYEEIAARFWNLPSKGAEEATRELYYMDDIIQKAHLDREIASHLDGVKTVLDAGAGSGRFSIPLAQKGLEVTHYDISQSMLAKAQELAKSAGISKQMEFVEGRLTELSRYQDGQFDLVICTDAPVSYTYPRHEEVLRELVRIAGKSVIISVSSRLGYFPYFFNPSQKLQYLLDEQADDPVVQWYVRNGQAQLENWTPDFPFTAQFAASGLAQDPDSIYAQLEQGETPWPVNYCFLPDELLAILTQSGLTNIQLSGPGALSRSIPQPILRKLLLTPEYCQQFLDQCYEFDRNPWVCGLGKDNLVASGVKSTK